MALIFKGRVSMENYIDNDGNNAQRKRQSFRAGMMKFKETWVGKEDVWTKKIDSDGKEVKDADGSAILEKTGERDVQMERITSLRTSDIGKSFDHWRDENDILARYPLAFDKA